MAGNSRPFMDILRELRGGQVHDQLSDDLQELVAAVTQEEKAGTLTLKITIKPRGKGDGLDVATEIVAKPPKPAPGVSVFFPTVDNNLVRADPRQQAMELHDIPSISHKGIA